MRRFFSFFLSILFGKNKIKSPSLPRILQKSGLNRRKNFRLLYPPFEALEVFPKILYRSKDFAPVNISVGGVCLPDALEFENVLTGTDIELVLQWSSFKTTVRAELVGCSHSKRHFRFIEIPEEALKRISDLLPFAQLGSEMKLIGQDSGPQLLLEAAEYWVGPQGQSLCFPNRLSEAPLLTIHQESFKLDWPNASAHADPNWGKALILLSNIPKPSPRVQTLLLSFNPRYLRNNPPQMRARA